MRRLCRLQSSLQVHSDRVMCVWWRRDRVGWSGASLGMPATLRPPWGEARLAGGRGQGWVTPHCSLQKEPDCSPLQCGRQHRGLMEQLLSLGILNLAVKPSWRRESLVCTCMSRLPQGPLGSWWESRKTSFCCVFLYHTSQIFFFLKQIKVLWQFCVVRWWLPFFSNLAIKSFFNERM